MTFIRNEIMPGVWLTCITTDKFKTGCLSINLLTQLDRDTAAVNALIPRVLRRGSREFPDMEQLSGELDRLYGASIAPAVRKLGEIQAIGLVSDFVDGQYVPGYLGLFNDMVRLTCQVLLEPDMKNGLFREDYVENEKQQQLDRLRGRINDKRSYATQRLIELMCCYEDYAVSRQGDEDSTESITARSLTEQYHHLLETSPIEIFYCGSCRFKYLRDLLLETLKDLPRGEIDYEIGTDIRMNTVEENTRYFTEELPVTQGKLSIGFRLGEVMDDPNPAALHVMNAIFGGCVTSKLFMNVREKLSLCYYASSMMVLSKGIMIVSSGIDFDKYDAALNEILSQLKAVQAGDFTDEELQTARRSVAAELRTYMDSEADLEHYWLTRNLQGDRTDPMELSEQVNAVTREDVIQAASTIVCDAVYFLKGDGYEEEEDEEA